MPSYINIQNDLPDGLTVSTGVLPPLDSKYWGVLSNSAIAGQLTQILWMDRNEGITNGDTWTFTTSFSWAGVEIQLMESLTGTFTSSDIAIQIVAGTNMSGWSSENTTLLFTGNDGITYQINGTFVADGTYDDVTYAILAV